MNEQAVIESTRLWVEKVVIDLNLCPFARRELVNERIRFAVTDAQTQEELLLVLQRVEGLGLETMKALLASSQVKP